MTQGSESAVTALAEEGGLSPLRLWAAVRKHWVLVVASVAVVTVAVAFYTLGQARIYQTEATVLIDPNPPRPLGKDVQGALDMGSGVYWTNREYYDTQLQLIRSRRIAADTVRALGLNKDRTFLADRPRSASADHGEVDVETAAQVLLARMTAEPVKNTRLLDVTLEDADPERGRRILSTHLDLYIQKNVDDAVTDTAAAADWMRDQLEKLRSELDKNELALHQYKEDKGILSVSLDDQSNILRDEMAQLNQELTRVRGDRERIAARVAELAKVDPENPDELPVTELLTSPVISTLRGNCVQLKQQRDALLAGGKGEKHPEVQSIIASVAECQKALTGEIRNVQQSLERELDASSKQAAGLAKLGEDAKNRALDLNLLEIEYRRLDRSKKNTERLFDLVLERSKDIDLTSQMRFNNIRVIDMPQVPKTPVRPNVPANMAAGLFAGLLIGFVVALSREELDRTIKSPEDLTRLGLVHLGILPRFSTGGPDRRSLGRKRRPPPVTPGQIGGPELMVHIDPRSAIAEAARAIRTNILFMSPDVPYRRLLIASAVPSEGKTTVACSIAIAMAQAGQRVVLLDCDLRRARLHRIFGRSNDIGLTSVLLDPDVLSQAILPTPVENLSVMASGPLPPNPAELLHSEAFGRLLDELGQRFDRIVIDSPPLVPVTDAAVLSTRVDGTILVVRPFMTRKDVARHAVRSLRDVSGRILGVVMNDLDLQRRDYGYYYHSGYYKEQQDASSSKTSDDAPAS